MINYWDVRKSKIMDYLSEGVIILDTNGTILEYNKKAKEILGFTRKAERSHEANAIRDGDLVFIIDTIIGDDDGNMVASDFKKIGVNLSNANSGQGILCSGIYGSCDGGIYKLINHESLGTYVLNGNFKNVNFSLVLNTADKYTSIIVNEEEYRLEYINSISNIVIIRDNEMIFYQWLGYSTRGEELKNILYGKDFQGKNPQEEFNPIGMNITDVHKDSEGIFKKFPITETNDRDFHNKYVELNKVPILASLHYLKNDIETLGVLFKFRGIKELTSLSKESDKASQILSEFTRRYHSGNTFPGILGISDNIKEVKELAHKASKTDSNVLILGDSGSGKSFLAKLIHESSNRSKKPFVSINCGAIPKELFESELFGYEKNDFTGDSLKTEKGLIESGNGGTVFFNEISELPLSMQTKLLSLIQEKRFFRVGGNVEVKVDIRMIFATNRDIEYEISQKRFSEDLFYRINVIPIKIKPLRERREDIPALVNDIFDRLKNEINEPSKILSIDAMNLLLVYDYPGNIREMENLLQRAISLSEGNVVNAYDFMMREYIADINGMSLKDILRVTEERVIRETLLKNNGDVKMTYEALGMGKTNFYNKVKEYSIDLERYR